MHGLALRVVRDPAQAEEVTQEAFLEIWRTASRYDSERGSAVSWLLTIAHRKAVDRVRCRGSQPARLDVPPPQPDRRPRHHGRRRHRLPRGTAGTDALGALTEVQREAIELAYFGGYTHTEVATLLDLPVGTAKTRIRDGLIRLRDTIGVGR